MISYEHLLQAQDYFRNCGYRSIEAPWIVPLSVMEATAPAGSTLFPISNEGYLVASGEQSFLALIAAGKLESGRYQCITPCFRDDRLDELHHRCFMKLELIDTLTPTQERLERMLKDCERFFNCFLPCQTVKVGAPSSIDLQGSSFDIVTTHGIELGSYGIRSHPSFGSWLYGTGCAEPRLSYAIYQGK